MSFSKHFVGAVLWAASLAVPARAGVILGQVDTFEDGTTQGWTVGGGPGGGVHPAPPNNIPTGGPAGVNDNYLRLTALGGGGPGSRLSAFNTSQWAGDYIAAGVTAISLDANNFGPADAYLRLLFWDSNVGPSNIAITDAVFVPPGSGWTHVAFAVDAASLITLLGDASTALSNATQLRLFHNPDPEFSFLIGPPAVNVVLGVDNILATTQAIPEPSSSVLAGVGLLAFFIWRRVPGLTSSYASTSSQQRGS